MSRNSSIKKAFCGAKGIYICIYLLWICKHDRGRMCTENTEMISFGNVRKKFYAPTMKVQTSSCASVVYWTIIFKDGWRNKKSLIRVVGGNEKEFNYEPYFFPGI